MMLNTLPWSEVTLGIAAALAILVVYDVIYVWPIHRRTSQLTERCAGLERSLTATRDELAARVVVGESRGRDDVGQAQ